MIFGQNRDALRQMYRDAWAKHVDKQPMSPLEAQIARVVEQHPEYHAAIADPSGEYTPERGETNPFLHLGMHLAIRDQVATDRPPGIRAVFDTLATKHGDPLAAEHQMMEALGEILWESQRNNSAPNERRYLERLRTMLR